MKKFLIGGAAAAAILVGGVAVGQVAPPSQPISAAHAHMMKPMTRAEVQGHVQAMFARLDSNHDGFITREEADAAGKMMHARFGNRQQAGVAGAAPTAGSANLRDRIFERLDSNHDGMISREEFNSMHGGGMRHHADMAGTGHMRGMAGRLFDAADANKDGRVSLQEMQAEALARFDRMDVNHDGVVSPDERHQMRLGHKRA